MRAMRKRGNTCRTLTCQCARVSLAPMDTRARETPYHAVGRWGRGRVRAIVLGARDLDLLFALFTHGALSSDMLKVLAAPADSQRATIDRLFLLKNPPNYYIVQPEAQARARQRCCARLVFEIAERGVHALVDAGRIAYDDYVLWSKVRVNFKPQHFHHDLAVGYVLASFALDAREAGIRFVSWWEILNRPRCPADTRDSRNPLAIPYETNGERHVLIPDGLFGLQYPNGACFFALEIDMGTEQQKDNALKSATLRQKFRAYRVVMRERLFASRFALPSLFLLTVTTGAVRMRNMMEHIDCLSDHGAQDLGRSFLFKAIPTLSPRSPKRPPVNGHILTIPWDRLNHPQLNLTNP